MNTMLSLDDGLTKLLNIVPTVEKMKIRDFRNPEIVGSHIHFTNGDTGRAFSVGYPENCALKQLTGLDTAMYSKLPESIQRAAWESLVERSDDEVYVKHKDGDVQSLSTKGDGSRVPPDYKEWIQDLAEYLKPIGVSNIYNGKVLSFAFVAEEALAPAKKLHDLVHRGTHFSLGDTVQGRPYNLRLACLNGALGIRFGDSARDLTKERYKEVLREILLQSNALAANMVALDDTPLGNSGGHLGTLRQLNITNAQQTALVATQLASLPADATMFDLVNLISANQHSSDDVRWLEVAGRVINHLSHATCSHCGSH
jgi:hypothetical protein